MDDSLPRQRDRPEAVLERAVAAALDRAHRATADDRDGVTEFLRLLDESPPADLKTFGDAVRETYAGGKSG
ncbi:hypothetical protein AB0H12_12195 [Actinosynnema sp. NPDC023794]